MSHNLTKFVHSVKVPRIYKNAAKIVQIAILNGGSIKHLLYSSVKANIKGCYALVTKTVQNNDYLDSLLLKTEILKENPRLDVFLAKTLITELLFGKGSLQGESKPVQTIQRYADIILKEFEAGNASSVNSTKSDLLKPRYVRVNTLKATCDEVIKDLRNDGWQFVPFSGTYPEFISQVQHLQEDEFMKDMHIKDLLVFPPRTEFYRHYLYQDATLILQDKASCLPPLALQLEPTNTVLDMCAAPGMKTTQMAALMRNKGHIHAMEQNERRHSDLQKIVKLSGCENVTTHLIDSLKIPSDDKPWCQQVDLILLDPTCSCSGMTEAARHFAQPKDEEKVRRLAGYQKTLLLHALTMFPSVRRVVYSTCSTLCEENEEVVAFALRKRPTEWNIVDAFPDWPSRGSDKYEFGARCLTARPQEDLTTGFFVAVFERNENISDMKIRKSYKTEKGSLSCESTETLSKNKTRGMEGLEDAAIQVKEEPYFDGDESIISMKESSQDCLAESNHKKKHKKKSKKKDKEHTLDADSYCGNKNVAIKSEIDVKIKGNDSNDPILNKGKLSPDLWANNFVLTRENCVVDNSREMRKKRKNEKKANLINDDFCNYDDDIVIKREINEEDLFRCDENEEVLIDRDREIRKKRKKEKKANLINDGFSQYEDNIIIKGEIKEEDVLQCHKNEEILIDPSGASLNQDDEKRTKKRKRKEKEISSNKTNMKGEVDSVDEFSKKKKLSKVDSEKNSLATLEDYFEEEQGRKKKHKKKRKEKQ